MKFKRHYLQDHRFLLTVLPEDVNDKNLMEHVRDLNEETKGLSNFRELADCRNVRNIKDLTVQGTVQCAETENERAESLLGILVPDSDAIYGMARAYQMFSENRRKQVKIFKDYSEALAWLADDEQEACKLNDFIKSI